MGYPGSRKRLLIVGGLAAGMSAAAEARRQNPALAVTVLERGPAVTWSRCSLPFYLAGLARSPLEAIRYDPAYFLRERNIEVRLQSEALFIDRHDGSLRVRDLARGGEYSLPFDRLVLATGMTPRYPCGWSYENRPRNVFSVGSLDEALRLRAWLDARPPGRAAIIGGGVLGLEMAWVLRRRGYEVVVLEAGPRPLGDVSPAMAAAMADVLVRNQVCLVCGVEVRVGAGMEEIHQLEAAGQVYPCDLVIAATGFRPETQLAQTAGIRPGPQGGIPVNERLRTDVDAIWACGDCAEFRCAIRRRPCLSRVAPTAIRSGYLAGAAAAGARVRMEGIFNPQLAKIFDHTHASAGLGPQAAAAWLGTDYATAGIESTELPAYMHEDAGRVRGEIYYSRRSGRLVGGQFFSARHGKRLDLLMLALQEGITLERLAALDLGYSPDAGTAVDAFSLLVRQALRS